VSTTHRVERGKKIEDNRGAAPHHTKEDKVQREMTEESYKPSQQAKNLHGHYKTGKLWKGKGKRGTQKRQRKRKRDKGK